MKTLHLLLSLFLLSLPTLGQTQTHPINNCSAFIMALKNGNSFADSLANNFDEAFHSLRQLRLKMSMETPQAKILNLNLDSKRLSSRQKEQLKSQLYGIEYMWKNKNEDVTKNNILASIQIKGHKEIKKFYDELELMANLINELKMTPSNRMAQAKRFINTMVGVGSFTLGAISKSLDADLRFEDLFLFLGGLQLTVNEPIALYLHKGEIDKNLINIREKLDAFLSRDSDNAEWIFNSWSYKPRFGTVSNLWNYGPYHENTRNSLGVQELWDSRGFFFKNYRPYEIKKTYPKENVAKMLEEESQAWVGIDQYVQKDQDGNPTLWLVMRATTRKPEYPKTVPLKEEKFEFKLELAPTLIQK
ncbi:MAG: hypothetical protein JNM93_08630 [Bacteriovoracaceae bacterium]|nr:hypothetical protein [Bacteriovoracaceae bacterium]